jgi:hypothetical protein
LAIFKGSYVGAAYAEMWVKMTKPSNNISDTERLQMSEPTKYIVRCCELRKRRQVKLASAPITAPRIRVNFEQ